jgi:alpha-L-fucosidase
MIKNRIFLLSFCLIALNLNARVNTDEIKNRPVPQWWQDSKFGIFIHWGLYSVPSFADRDYAEWYKGHMRGGKAKEFHERVYGKDFAYEDFAEMFKAEFFDPDDWAELFKQAGAKYVVLTAKHMEGFTLWQSDIANKLHGRKWNSVETGPERDIVGELSQAVKNKGLRMGLYFMLYEHMTQLYLENPELFIKEYSIPQFKDLYSTYQPSIVWVDGSWQHTTSEYQSYELLQWLLENMPHSHELVFNNRWGKDDYTTGHGTTEYTYMLNPESLPGAWEECRGIGASFGFNRNERFEDYNTSQELILILIDVVSNGGNLLLNVGPTSDGRIPVFMRERLLDIGKWLEINGEAIYGTTKNAVTTQWSEGKRIDINPRLLDEPITDGVAERMYILENFNILKLTVNPEEGQAVKEIMFTRKGNDVFAITPKFPSKQLEIRHVVPSSGTQVSLLGARGKLEWSYENSVLKITVPADLVLEMPFQHAWTFKITNVAD